MRNPVDAAIIKICRAYNYPVYQAVANARSLALKLMEPIRRPEYRQMDKNGDILIPGCFGDSLVQKMEPAISNLIMAQEYRDRFLRRGK
jgi:hypothetical protein